MKKRILSLCLFGMILLVGCVSVNPAEKKACENSGGTYEEGFSETGGAYWYCKCPAGKYSTYEKICKDIGQTEISKCQSLSTSYADCDSKGGKCTCIHDGIEIAHIQFGDLMSEKCECPLCVETICNCVCQR